MSANEALYRSWKMTLSGCRPLALEIYGEPALFGYGCLSCTLCADSGGQILRRIKYEPVKMIRELGHVAASLADPSARIIYAQKTGPCKAR